MAEAGYVRTERVDMVARKRIHISYAEKWEPSAPNEPPKLTGYFEGEDAHRHAMGSAMYLYSEGRLRSPDGGTSRDNPEGYKQFVTFLGPTRARVTIENPEDIEAASRLIGRDHPHLLEVPDYDFNRNNAGVKAMDRVSTIIPPDSNGTEKNGAPHPQQMELVNVNPFGAFEPQGKPPRSPRNGGNGRRR